MCSPSPATRPRQATTPARAGLPDRLDRARVVSQLNRGEDVNGRAIDAPTSFFLGVAVNPSADDLELEVERFEAKLEAGARFAMTQVLFDLDYLDRFIERLGRPSPIPLLIGLWPLWSHQLALRVHNEVPGITVPDVVQRALERAGPDAADEGMRIARELYAQARDIAAGVYVVAPFRRPLAAVGILE